eukprot:gene2886-4729_t
MIEEEKEVLCDICSENIATLFCKDCEQGILCQSCSKFFHSTKKRSHHIPESLNKKQTSKINCSRHNKERLKLYCKDCECLVCLSCVTENHSGHFCCQPSEGINELCTKLLQEEIKLDEKIKKQNLKLNSFQKVSMEIEEEKEILKKEIEEGFEDLKNILKKKEENLKAQVENFESSKLKKIRYYSELLKTSISNLNFIEQETNELIKKKDTTIEFCDDLINFKQKIEKENENDKIENTPEIYHTVHKTFDATSYVENLKSLCLIPTINPSLCSVIPETYFNGIIEEELKFTLILKDKIGKLISLHEYEHNIRIFIETKPKNLTKEPILIMKKKGDDTFNGLSISFQSFCTGIYTLRILCGNQDVKDSPYKIEIFDELPATMDLKIKLNDSLNSSFNFLKQNFWFKDDENRFLIIDFKGEILQDFDLSEKLKNEIKFNSFSFDKDGNIYCADGHKHFFKFDPNWELKFRIYPAEGNFSSSILFDGEFILAIYKRGPLLILDKDQGTTIEIIKIENLENVTDFVLLGGKIFILDSGIIKCFTKKGYFLYQIDDFINVKSITVVNYLLYACQNNSSKWVKVYSPKDALIINLSDDEDDSDLSNEKKSFFDKLSISFYTSNQSNSNKDLRSPMHNNLVKSPRSQNNLVKSPRNNQLIKSPRSQTKTKNQSSNSTPSKRSPEFGSPRNSDENKSIFHTPSKLNTPSKNNTPKYNTPLNKSVSSRTPNSVQSSNQSPNPNPDKLNVSNETSKSFFSFMSPRFPNKK